MRWAAGDAWNTAGRRSRKIDMFGGYGSLV